jgi:uncharacterized membrane protein YkvA (DUF1232 family)
MADGDRMRAPREPPGAIGLGRLRANGGRDAGRRLAPAGSTAVLVSRLLRDPRVPRRHKLLPAALVGYLALPFDLVPDFIAVAGYADDALLVALTLRAVLRATGGELLREHWPGPESSLSLLRPAVRPAHA